jgi:hypothetical protein
MSPSRSLINVPVLQATTYQPQRVASQSTERPTTVAEEDIPMLFSPKNWTGSHLSAASDTGYSTGELRMMDTELFRARHNGELPRTTSSPTDTRTTIEDYGYLTQLREARGDVSGPATESYNQLRVEIARRIHERDSYSDEEEVKKEATRRVTHYLRSVQQEQALFDMVSSNAFSETLTPPESPHFDVETFGQELLSVVEQAADQTIINATEPMSQLAEAYAAIFKTQENTLATMTQALDYVLYHTSSNVSASQQHLTVLSAGISQLSQLVTNLPLAIDQVVYQAVNQHMRQGFHDLIKAREKDMLARLEPIWLERQGALTLDTDALVAQIVVKLQSESGMGMDKKGKFRGRMGRLTKKISLSCQGLVDMML